MKQPIPPASRGERPGRRIKNLWHDFLDSLDSPGGHIFVLLLLVLLAVGLTLLTTLPLAERIGEDAFIALIAILRPAKSNSDRTADAPPSAVINQPAAVGGAPQT